MKRRSKQKQPAAAANPNAVYIEAKPGDDHAALLAQSYLRPSMQAATLVRAFNQRNGTTVVRPSLRSSASLQMHTTAVAEHDLGRAEAMLIAQAHALDSIFAEVNCLVRISRHADRVDPRVLVCRRGQGMRAAVN